MRAEGEQENPEWVLLYRDRVAELWGRSYRFDDPISPDYMPLRHRVQDPSPREGDVPWPALPIRDEPNQLASDNPQATTTESSIPLPGTPGKG